MELVRSADHFADVVLVCWHGGNAEAVARAVRRTRDEGRALSCWQPRPTDPADVHAGWIETSLMLALAPMLVRDTRPAGPGEPLAALACPHCAAGASAVSSSGVLGDAQARVGRRGPRPARLPRRGPEPLCGDDPAGGARPVTARSASEATSPGPGGGAVPGPGGAARRGRPVHPDPRRRPSAGRWYAAAAHGAH